MILRYANILSDKLNVKNTPTSTNFDNDSDNSESSDSDNESNDENNSSGKIFSLLKYWAKLRKTYK